MRLLLCGVILVSAGTVTAQDISPGPRFLDHVEFRTLSPTRQSFSWQQAEFENIISLGNHVIAPNDTYFKIIERYGMRADPNSLRLIRALNDDRFEVLELPVGGILQVIVNQQSEPMVVALDTDLKESIERRLTTFKNKRDTLDVWVVEQGDRRTQVLYQSIIEAVQGFRETGYALDRAVLSSVNEALDIGSNIIRSFTAERRLPNDWEIKILEIISETIRSVFSVASDIDENRITVRVATVVQEDHRHISGLQVCFRLAMDLLIYRAKYGVNQNPKWGCSVAFDSLSSPAVKRFVQDLGFVIWATHDSARVSEYQIIRIEPNQPDDSFHSVLPVSTP